ncbi:MAG: hypothetical protein HKP30_12100, partial [Myxococcales bacterium]|nr:hypothetical protein [Myxococcales bacterium]
MTASRVEIAALLLLTVCVGACTTPAGAPPKSAFLPAAHVSARPPNAVDRTAAALARAALVGDRADAERALQSIAALESVLVAAEEPSTGIYDVATDLRNTT